MRRGALFRSGAASMHTFDAAPAATRPETFGSGLLRPLYRRIPVSVPAGPPLRLALARTNDEQVGSVVVTDA